MSAPDPRVLNERLNNIRGSLSRIPAEYAWLYPMGYERSVRDGEKVTVSGVRGNDDLIISTYAARRALEEASRKVSDAEDLLRLAEGDLRKALGRHDPREGFEALRYPRSATRADLAEAKAAKERRIERGEALP